MVADQRPPSNRPLKNDPTPHPPSLHPNKRPPRDFGGKKEFAGPAYTIRCFENNPLVRKAVNSPGNGRVLVVDGGGSMRCALLGDMLAGDAAKNGWEVSSRQIL